MYLLFIKTVLSDSKFLSVLYRVTAKLWNVKINCNY